MRAAFGAAVRRPSTLAAVLLVAVAVAASALAVQYGDRTRWVRHTLEAETGLADLLAAVQDAEIAQRGYLVTGDEAHLAPWRAAEERALAGLDALARQTEDNPAQQRSVGALRLLVTEKFNGLRGGAERRRAGDAAGAAALAAADGGRELTDRFRAALAAMRAEEERLLAERTAAAEASGRLLVGTAGLAGALSVLLALLPFAAARREARMLRTAGEAEGAARREAEARLRELADASEDVFWVADPDKPALLYVNAGAFERVWGFPAAEARERYMAWINAVHPEDRERVRTAVFERAASAGLDEEYRVVRPDGSVVWVRDRGYPVRDPATGGTLRVVGTARDVTARRAAQEALREAEERWRAIAEASPMLVFVTDAAGANIYTNPQFQAFTGHAAEELLGDGWLRVVHPEDAERAAEAWQAAVRTGEPYEIEYRFRARDGGWRWFLGRGIPVRDERGAIGRWFGACADIEDVVAAREALARSRDEQERLVAERTAELVARNAELVAEMERRERLEDQLRQAQKMEAVGQLTGGVAHDFNNMLAVVMGNLELLERRAARHEGAAEELGRFVQRAKEGAKRAATLTQQLLAFSRRQPLRPEPVEANRLVAGMSDLLRRTLGERVVVETVLAGGLWRTHADPNQLENALLNLAVNARDALPPEGGKLTIETANAHLDERYAARHVGVPPGQYVMVAVTDTGSGMPAEVQARAFEPFFTTKEVGKGTGLGLSQVYGFVRQSGGHVKIYSEAGQGTAVKLYLPRFTDRGDGAAPDGADEADAAAVPAAEDRASTVLVVEDDEMMRRASADALAELGYRVLEADGAAAALRLLDAHAEVGLLFTDVVMPEVNGRKLADEALRRRPGLKVLFTTGYTRNAVVHNGALDASVEMLAKPFTLQEMGLKVRALLAAGPALPAAAAESAVAAPAGDGAAAEGRDGG